MGKLSQLNKAIANVYAKRDLLDAVIAELEGLKTQPTTKKPKTVRKVGASVAKGSWLDEMKAATKLSE